MTEGAVKPASARTLHKQAARRMAGNLTPAALRSEPAPRASKGRFDIERIRHLWAICDEPATVHRLRALCIQEDMFPLPELKDLTALTRRHDFIMARAKAQRSRELVETDSLAQLYAVQSTADKMAGIRTIYAVQKALLDKALESLQALSVSGSADEVRELLGLYRDFVDSSDKATRGPIQAQLGAQDLADARRSENETLEQAVMKLYNRVKAPIDRDASDAELVEDDDAGRGTGLETRGEVAERLHPVPVYRPIAGTGAKGESINGIVPERSDEAPPEEGGEA